MDYDSCYKDFVFLLIVAYSKIIEQIAEARHFYHFSALLPFKPISSMLRLRVCITHPQSF